MLPALHATCDDLFATEHMVRDTLIASEVKVLKGTAIGTGGAETARAKSQGKSRMRRFSGSQH